MYAEEETERCGHKLEVIGLSTQERYIGKIGAQMVVCHDSRVTR